MSSFPDLPDFTDEIASIEAAFALTPMAVKVSATKIDYTSALAEDVGVFLVVEKVGNKDTPLDYSDTLTSTVSIVAVAVVNADAFSYKHLWGDVAKAISGGLSVQGWLFDDAEVVVADGNPEIAVQFRFHRTQV